MSGPSSSSVIINHPGSADKRLLYFSVSKESVVLEIAQGLTNRVNVVKEDVFGIGNLP